MLRDRFSVFKVCDRHEEILRLSLVFKHFCPRHPSPVYSFVDFLAAVDAELLTLIDKTSADFPEYEFESDFDSNFPVALSAQEAVIQHGSISEVQIVDPDNILVFDSPYA